MKFNPTKFFSYLLLFFILISQTVYAQTPPANPTRIGFSFTPPPADLSVAYLSDIFGVVDGVLHGTGSQLLGTMFGVFNAAILTIGGIVITYILFVSTMNTAHEGKVLGQKWSSIWIPIRAVIGIGAMLPKASGYSFIQIFLMWLIVQGVGAADSIWYTALNYFQRGGILVQHVQSLGQVGGGDEKNLAIIFPAGAVLKSEVCMYTLRNALLNKQSQKPEGSQVTLPPVPDFTSTLIVEGEQSKLSPPCYPGDTRPGCQKGGDSRGVIYFPGNVSYGVTNYKGVCGTLSWDFTPPRPADPNNPQGQSINYANLGAYDTRSIAAQQIVLDTQPLAFTLANIILPTGQNQSKRPITDNDMPISGLVNAATDYIAIMRPALNTAGEQARQDAAKVLNSAAQSGWILAGSYYFTLSRLNQMIKAVEATPPKTSYPTDYTSSSFPNDARDALGTNVSNVAITSCGSLSSNPLDAFICKEYITAQNQASPSAGPPPSYPTPQGRQQAGPAPWWQQNLGARPAGDVNPDVLGYLGFKSRIPTLSFWDMPWDPLRNTINYIPNKINEVMDNLQNAITNLSSAQQSNLDPIVSISNLGYQILDTVEWLWLWGAVGVLFAGLIAACPAVNPLGFMLGYFLLWFVPLMTGILFSMFIAGAMMAYYVPLIPLIVFLFTAIGWFVAVIEGMIAGPIVALGLIIPEGHDYLGKAEHAVMLILNVFLRPTLIIFGFISASILVNVALWLWNVALGVTMSQGIINTGFSFHISSILSVVAILIIYMTVVLSIVNRCFALIHEIPSHVLNWIGGNIRDFGGKEEGQVAGQVESKMGVGVGGFKGAMQAGEKGATDLARKGGEKLKGLHKKGKGGDIQVN